MLSQLLNRECTITRRTSTGFDDYGEEQFDDVEIETVCELQQRSREEHEGELSDTSWLLILPPATFVHTGDSVTVAGEVFELVGDPWRARNPRTGLDSHIEATARRTASADEEVGS